ncbi:MAG TPA: chemotaxis protein CheW [Edaphobacter sp.]|nr:chemotaxis protein CheW [Edaphobacter sp.]
MRLDIENTPDAVEHVQNENDMVSLCSLYAGDGSFGIDTRKIREVLGKKSLQRVPMAPPYIGGVVPYRGEVLTTVNLRALLGMAPHQDASCVLVLEENENAERFGLIVDEVGGVIAVNQKQLEDNPSTLDARGRWLFDGAYKLQAGLVVQLDPQKLRPSRLADAGLFK